MSNNKNRISQLGLVGIALMGFGLNACLSDDSDKDSKADTAGKSSGGSGGTAGSGGAGTSTGAAGSGGGGTVPGAVCASPIKLTTDKAAIADFDDYDGAADLTKWSFALGADSSTGVFSGPFAYGDHDSETSAPETFEMVEGNESTYALSVSDSESTEYGGGLGLWMSECLDASAFSGISFWARGKAPTGKVKFSLMMEETTSSTPDKADSKKGTCGATQDKCIHPIADVAISDAWTEIKVPWSDFMLGSAAGNPVEADGTNVWQLQIEVPLEWKADDAGEYHPTPSDYELAIDSVAFY